MPVPEFETLTIEYETDQIAVLSLNRPDRMNAMTAQMFADLESAAGHLDRDGGLRAVVITGRGRAFCAGYDLDEAAKLATISGMEMLSLQEKAARAQIAMRAIRVPLIAAVNGAATGGGLALALAADIRLGSSSAKFSAAFVRIGLSAGDMGTSWLLPRTVGPALASEIAYTGRLVYAEEAERIGLINKQASDDKLVDEAVSMAELICANSPGGVQLSKRALHANMEVGSYAAALELENRGQALLTRGEDMPEALLAMQEKRAPKFSGR